LPPWQTLATPETHDRLAEQGIDVAGSSADEFANFIKSKVAKWAKVIKEAGISAD
jgi:tripartite-type tricarboxylate transporter receptor subunit TctC